MVIKMNLSKSLFRSKLLLYIIFFFTVVSCSFQKQFKSTKSTGNKIYPIEITHFLKKVGFYSNLREMYGSTISFYLQDSLGNPACFEKCFLYQRDNITTDLITNNSGIIRIRLSPDVLNEDCYIISENPYYHFIFYYTASGVRNSSEKVNVVMLDSLNLIPTPNNTLIFISDPNNIDQRMKLEDIEVLLDMQYKIIKEMLNAEPIKWGLILSLKEQPIHFYEPRYYYNKNWHHLHAFSLLSESLSNILLTNSHEWTESSITHYLKSKDQNIRWIQDGLAELSLILFAEKLSLKERERFSIQNEIKNKLNIYFTYLKKISDNGKNNIDFDLTKWKLASKEKVYSEKDKLGYSLSLYFWLSIKKEYGLEKISDFFTNAIIIKNGQREDYIKLLSQICGKDIRPLLSNFDIKNILDIISTYSQNLQIDQGELSVNYYVN